jgi:acetyl esterase/lipase
MPLTKRAVARISRWPSIALNPDLQVTSRTPPTFLLQAEDDPVDPVENSLVYDSALRKAGVPAEMHCM